MLKEYLIYWIHNEDESDIHTQGYVGITNNFKRRLAEHKRHKGKILDGRSAEIILHGEKDYCKEVEKILRPKKNIGLNIMSGGGIPPDATGLKRSDATKLLMSINNVGFKGRKHSEETKKKMRETRKGIGRPHTEETKRKLSEIAKQRKINPMTGRKHSEKTRQLISEKLRNRKTYRNPL